MDHRRAEAMGRVRLPSRRRRCHLPDVPWRMLARNGLCHGSDCGSEVRWRAVCVMDRTIRSLELQKITLAHPVDPRTNRCGVRDRPPRIVTDIFAITDDPPYPNGRFGDEPEVIEATEKLIPSEGVVPLDQRVQRHTGFLAEESARFVGTAIGKISEPSQVSDDIVNVGQHDPSISSSVRVRPDGAELIREVGHRILGRVAVALDALAVAGRPCRPGRAVDGGLGLARSLDDAANLPSVGQCAETDVQYFSCRPAVPSAAHGTTSPPMVAPDTMTVFAAPSSTTWPSTQP